MMEERGALFEEMFLASPDALMIVDPVGRVEMASPSMADLFGYQPEEVAGCPAESLVPELLSDVRVHPGLALVGRHRSGRAFPVDVSLVPITLSGQRFIGAFVRDASERRRGEDVLRFVNEISRGVIAGEPTSDLLALTAEKARRLVGAASSWITVQDRSEDQMVVAAADGVAAETLRGAVVPASSSLAARAIRQGRTVAVPDMAGDPDVLAEARAAGFGSGLYVPMQAEAGPIGSLVLARARGSEPFGGAEVAAAEVFASAAGIVLALGTARLTLDELRMSADHERIARDLHDTVIQRLFGLGMRLQAAERLAEGAVAERIRATVDAIDDVIREIRETIFDLNRPPTPAGAPHLRQRIRALVADASEGLGFRPRLAIRGPVESLVAEHLFGPLSAVLREALANVGRHAGAASADVVVAAGEGSLTVSVADDGVGLWPGPAAGQGLGNMAARAEALGGTMTIGPRRPTGTLLQWSVPLGSLVR